MAFAPLSHHVLDITQTCDLACEVVAKSLRRREETEEGQQEYSRHPFLLAVDELYCHFDNTNAETGLSQLKAQEAQEKYGPNKLEGEGVVQWYSVLLKQISNAMILVWSLASAFALLW